MRTGEIQTLQVSRISDFGLYLKDDEGNEVLLPNRFTRLDMKEGDEVEVFVYHDSEDRLVASTERPFIKVGEVAAATSPTLINGRSVDATRRSSESWYTNTSTSSPSFISRRVKRFGSNTSLPSSSLRYSPKSEIRLTCSVCISPVLIVVYYLFL